MTESSRLTQFRHDGLTFDVDDTGPPDGPTVILLHGWPADSSCWSATANLLHRRGLRTLALDQRGYSPQARPPGRSPYAISNLVADVIALAGAAGCEQFQLVGHDWGGSVAWHLAAMHPTRVSALTVLSTPHPAAMRRAMIGDQALRSSYMAFFQLPLLPEAILLAARGAVLRIVLERSGLDTMTARRYVERLRAPGALAASLAWYRALPFDIASTAMPITVPVTYAWGTADGALGRRAAEATSQFVDGPYQFEVIQGGSHWLPEDHPDTIANLIAEGSDR